MNTTESQNAMILRDLSKGVRLTHLDAQNNYRCSRLAARINDLKRAGYPIQKAMVKTRTGKSVAEYSLPAGTIVVDNLQKAS